MKRSLILETSLVTFEARYIRFSCFRRYNSEERGLLAVVPYRFDMSSLVNQSWTRVTWGFYLQFCGTPDLRSLYYSNAVWAETDQFWDLKGGV